MSVQKKLSKIAFIRNVGEIYILKNIAKTVYRALFFLTRDCTTKSQKSKKLPVTSKIYKVPSIHAKCTKIKYPDTGIPVPAVRVFGLKS